MNEHDLHSAFDALARRGAGEQAERLRHGVGLDADRVAATARRHRRRRAVVGAVAGVAVLGGAVLAGAVAVGPPEPQPPATPTPAPVSPSPTPSSSPGPPPSPAEDDTALLRAYPTAPVVAWATAGSDLLPADAESGWGLGDVTASFHSFTDFRSLAATGTWLVASGGPSTEHLVALDAETGAVRWSRPEGDDRPIMCGGVHDGLLVCQTPTAVDLRDPVSGAVVRTLAVGTDGVQGIAVVGDTLVLHGSEGTDVRVRAVDLGTGEMRADLLAPDRVDPDAPIGDGVVMWERSGDLVLLRGLQYDVAVDVRSWTLLAPDLVTLVGVRGDGWVSGYAADGTAHAVGPQGQDVPLPGTSPSTVGLWAPDDDGPVPLLSGSDSGDGLPDAVRATDPATGELLWSVPGTSVVQAVAGSTAVLLGDDGLVGVDVRTGAELWRSGSGDTVGFDGERLFLRSVGQNLLQARDVADGTIAWELPVDPEHGVGTVDGTLVLLGADSSIAALLPEPATTG